MKKITLLSVFLLMSLFALGQAHLYGVLPSGGNDNLGAIYKTDSVGNNLNIIHDFTLDEGTYRAITQEMIEISGKMYGLGLSKSDNIEIYSFELSTQTFKVEVKNVPDSMGETPGSSILRSTDGKYYFITSKGGANNQGTLLEFNPVTNALIKKHDF